MTLKLLSSESAFKALNNLPKNSLFRPLRGPCSRLPTPPQGIRLAPNRVQVDTQRRLEPLTNSRDRPGLQTSRIGPPPVPVVLNSVSPVVLRRLCLRVAFFNRLRTPGHLRSRSLRLGRLRPFLLYSVKSERTSPQLPLRTRVLRVDEALAEVERRLDLLVEAPRGRVLRPGRLGRSLLRRGHI